jgi:biotin synthase-related radical SAM superfamily protein
MMIDFNEKYILENNKVRLTPLKKDDFGNLVHFATNELQLWTHSLIQASSPEKMKI